MSLYVRCCSLALWSLFTVLILSSPVLAGANDRVEICHRPPDNPQNVQTITVGANALAAHLAHGDFPGPCETNCTLQGTSICDDDNLCTSDSCNPSTGACIHVAVNCNDTNSCTNDSCDKTRGCVNTPNVGAGCDDTNDCTDLDTCNDRGQCQGTPVKGCCLKDADCDDTNACTIDKCDLTTKTCTNTQKTCDDGQACTVDSCDPSD